MKFDTLSRLTNLMKLVLISSHLVDIQGREHYLGDLI